MLPTSVCTVLLLRLSLSLGLVFAEGLMQAPSAEEVASFFFVSPCALFTYLFRDLFSPAYGPVYPLPQVLAYGTWPIFQPFSFS